MICRPWYCPSLMFSLCYKSTNNLLDFLDVFKHRVFILESDQNAHVHLDFYKIKQRLQRLHSVPSVLAFISMTV